MTQGRKPRKVRKAKPPTPPQGKRNWIIHLIDKGFDSIVAAGPVAWVSIVAIVGMCGMVFIFYLVFGGSTRAH
jgi:hypothetical protein